MPARYDLLLDLYPLLTSLPHEADILALRIEQTAFDLLIDDQTPPDRLLLLLRLGRDLGYLDERLYSFLERKALAL